MNLYNLLLFILLTNSLQTRLPNKNEVPTVITLAKNANKSLPFIIFVSGDGGWKDFEQEISDRLASKGYNIIGVDANKYFWKKKSIDQTTQDISALINKYQLEWNQQKVALIGYSMGASVVPFIYEQFTKLHQENVKSLVLFSPAYRIDFEIKYLQMLGFGLDNAENDVFAEIKNSNSHPKYSIFVGKDEDSTLIESSLGHLIRLESIPGDHHYLNDYNAILKAILSCKIL